MASVQQKRRENIKVFVRIRPLVPREVSTALVAQVGEDPTEVLVDSTEHSVTARFDRVFGPSTPQEAIYEQCRYIADSVVEGFNATMFAYGQTGSGKTFTMFGAEDDRSLYLASALSAQAGVIPRMVRDVLASAKDDEVSVHCSFLQIYNDQVYDLMRDPLRARALTIHEDSDEGIFVEGLSEYAVRSVPECLALLERSDEQRACRSTYMNDVSSRSHSVFQMLVERRVAGRHSVVRSKLNLVDLAGSEKWNILSDMHEAHVSELTNINTSLYTLGRCIAALTDANATHVPFRDSKLTRLLQDALGGNARTCVIATLSPSEACVEESISTLKFADRAKRVMQHAKVTETRVVSLALVLKLEREVEHLRSLLNRLDPAAADHGTNGDGGGAVASPSAEGEGAVGGGTGGGGALMALERELCETKEALRESEGRAADLRRQLDATAARGGAGAYANAEGSATADGGRCARHTHTLH